MFTFFAKHVFLSDLLEDAIDIHCHILPGIDDGASNLDISREMLTAYQNLGFQGIIATPHIMEDYYHNTAKSILETLEVFKRDITTNLKLPYKAAAEYMLEGNFSSLLQKNELLTLGDDKVLVEFSYFQRSNSSEQQIFDIQANGYRPVLAHPERYSYLTVDEILDLKKRGCLLQLNLLSLSQHYGKDVQKKALALLTEGGIDFTATDAHKPYHLEKIRDIKITKKLEAGLINCIVNTRETFATSF